MMAYYDLSASGGPARISAVELAHVAARAKTRVKASARGWSMLSQIDIIALAFFADLALVDVITPAAPAQPRPPLISEV